MSNTFMPNNFRGVPCEVNDQLAGFRFYPGKDSSQDLVLIIGLRGNGTEAFFKGITWFWCQN